MKVKELIKLLLQVENQDGLVQIAQCEEDFANLEGIAFCEEDTGIILCDKETLNAFR